MDFLQDQITSILTNASANTSTTSTASSILSTLHTIYNYASTYLSQVLPLLPTTLPTTSADITSLVVFALVLFSAYKVLDYVRRLIMFWVFLAVKLVVVVALVQVALYVYTYGVEKTLRDAGWIWGMVEGLFEDTIEAGRAGWNQNAVGGNSIAGWGGQRGQGVGSRKMNRNRGGKWT